MVLKYTIYFVFLQTLDDGVLMYCAQRESGEGDFASLAIRNKRLEFRFNTGSGTANIYSGPLQQDQWIEVSLDKQYIVYKLYIRW